MQTLAQDINGTYLARFIPTDAAISAMSAEYMPLVINGLEDTRGFELVHAARMKVKNLRVRVDKVRKDLKQDALEWGRKVDAEAKRITALLEPIETHLQEEEDAIEREKERIRNAERLREEAEAKAKADAEAARIKAEQEAEAARVKAIQDAENARLKAEAARLAEQQRKIDEERQAIEAEKKRLADIEAARQREIENERIRKEAAEKSRIETEQRIAREAAEAKAKAEAEALAAKQRAEAEEASRLRAEAMRPDREKLLSVVSVVRGVAVPVVSDASQDYANAVQTALTQCADRIASIVSEM